jgi:hypothetical protein
MPTCSHCEAESPAEHYDRVVHNTTSLHGPWRGWRLAGRHLVSPDGDRITPERMRGILARLELEARRDRARARAAARRSAPVKVVIVDLADYRHQGVAAA